MPHNDVPVKINAHRNTDKRPDHSIVLCNSVSEFACLRVFCIRLVVAMLNGKFYTGLTAKQLNRTQAAGAPDRFKSSFFWPDETDSQPSTQYRASAPRTRQLSAPVVAGQQQTTVSKQRDVEPRELFHKQLTSKIEFNDDLKTTPKPRRRGGKFAGIATAQDLSDIAASIEKPQSNGNRTTEHRIENNARKSMAKGTTDGAHMKAESVKQQQQTRRKITFDEPTTTITKRGILKNNDVRSSNSIKRNDYVVEPIPVYKKNIVQRAPMTRLQLSKSMDNFARLEITGTAVGTVGDSKTKRNNVEHEREVHERRAAEKRDVHEFEEPTDEPDYPEREYYEKWGAGDADEPVTQVEHRQAQQRTIQHNIDVQGGHHHHQQQQHYHNETQSHSQGNHHHQRHNQRANDVIGYAKQYADVKQAPVQPVEIVKTPATPLPPPPRYYANEAAQRAQTHLRSNIFFNDGEVSGARFGADDRPRSVRESAVARVGVGLPNI